MARLINAAKAATFFVLTVLIAGFVSEPVLADVPEESAVLYQENGAVPGDANCRLLASTISIGLGNYYCRTFAADLVDEFCAETVPDNTWGDLEALQTNYLDERQSDSPDAGFAHQFLCIAEKSCENFEAQGESGWASDFVKSLFDTMQEDGPIPGSVEFDCPSFFSNDLCFEYKGHFLHAPELIYGFYSYCDQKGTLIDYDRWDSDHSTFLERGVSACLQDVINAGDLSDVWAPRITGPAAALREAKQLDCRIWTFIRSGGSAVGSSSDGLPTRLSEPLAKNRASIDVIVPDNLRKPAPRKEDFYFSGWNEAGSLDVNISDDTFFVTPGSQVVVSVSARLSDGSVQLLDSSVDIEYQLLSNAQHAEISANGVLSIKSVVSPFSTPSKANIVLVAAFYNGQYGLGQVHDYR